MPNDSEEPEEPEERDRLLCDSMPGTGLLPGDILLAALPGGVAALRRAVPMVAHHPCIDFVLLEAPGAPNAAGESGGLRIEHDAGPRRQAGAGATCHCAPAEAAPVGAHYSLWPPGAPSMPGELRTHGLLCGARFSLGEGGATLTVAGRGRGAAAACAVNWCRAAALVLRASLERGCLEDELVTLQGARGTADLAAAVVHDLSNVLTGVIGFNAALGAAIPPDHPAQHEIELIDSLGVRGAALTRQLLDFARGTVEAGAGDRELSALDLNALVRDVRTLTDAVTPGSVTVEIDAGLALPRIRGNSSLLQQALTNLVLNAADATTGAGRVLLRTSLRRYPERHPEAARTGSAPGAYRQYVAVEVIDHGSGISPEILPRVFDPFFTTKHPSRGTGLGLVSTRRIVERHGGSVEVASTPGEGSTFTVLLPVTS